MFIIFKDFLFIVDARITFNKPLMKIIHRILYTVYCIQFNIFRSMTIHMDRIVYSIYIYIIVQNSCVNFLIKELFHTDLLLYSSVWSKEYNLMVEVYVSENFFSINV